MLSTGELAVASDFPVAVRLFGADGALRRTVGTRGRGPGEFSSLDRLFRLGDTLVVVDLEEAEHRFGPDGRYLCSVSLPGMRGQLHGFFANGDRVIGQVATDSVPLGGSAFAPELVTHVGTSSQRQLGAFRSQYMSRSRDGRISSEVYTPHNRVAVFPDGYCAGHTDGAHIECFRDDATLQGTITLTGRRLVPVSDADREDFVGDVSIRMTGSPREAIEAEVARLRERLAFARDLGYFGRLLPARDDRLWVGPPSTDAFRFSNRNAVPHAATTWSVFERSGAWVADVQLPPRFLPLEAGTDYVAGVTRNDDAEVVVLVFDLVTRQRRALTSCRQSDRTAQTTRCAMPTATPAVISHASIT